MEQNIEDTYRTIAEKSEGRYKEKGSKFHAYAFPAENVDDIKIIIASLRKEFYDARHVCYAYRLGYKGDEFRINDDGEPSGTAGKPIYGQILSHQLTQILIVVVRYFGGTKLGVSGLIQAYKEASIDAIAHATILEKIVYEKLHLQFNYDLLNDVMRIIKAHDLQINTQNFAENCSLLLDLRLSEYEHISSIFAHLHGVQIK